MIRSAAKNHRFVLVVTSPDRYEKVLGDLDQHQGSSCGKHRLKQAQRAFAHTAEYDALIADYLASAAGMEPEAHGAAASLDDKLTLQLHKAATLRYGENPHQKAGLYVGERPQEPSVAFARQLHGKELSYINLLDADAALSAAKELTLPGACIVKHATPCGFATGGTIAEAFTKAFAGDPLAAFGGIVALNRPVDLAAANAITAINKLLEVIVAPSFDPDALELLKQRWKNVRLLEVGSMDGGDGASRVDGNEVHLHKIVGGYLIQQRDLTGLNEADWKVVTARQPTEAELAELRIAWLACKHLKSNAIALVKDGMMVGGGAGQQDRVNAARIAIAKAGERAKGSVAASDAFFPFPDGPQLLLDAGVTALIQPGGSVKDNESIAAVNAAGAAMIFTGQRHFKH